MSRPACLRLLISLLHFHSGVAPPAQCWLHCTVPLQISGTIQYNGLPLDAFQPRRTAGLVQQQDSHIPGVLPAAFQWVGVEAGLGRWCEQHLPHHAFTPFFHPLFLSGENGVDPRHSLTD